MLQLPRRLMRHPHLGPRNGQSNTAPVVIPTQTNGAAQMRVALFGNFGTGNFGNDGSLRALLSFLQTKCPDIQLSCICPDEETIRTRMDLPALPIEPKMPEETWFRLLNRIVPRVGKRLFHLVSTLRAVGQFDAIIVPGTGILDDFADRWQGMPLSLFMWGLAARLRGRPFAFLSIGAGPIEHALSRWLMKWAARMARFRSFRDQASKDYLAGLDVNTASDRITPDIAFSLPLIFPVLDRKTGNDGLPIIGIGVMSYSGWRHAPPDGEAIYSTYITKISRFAAWLLHQGYGVRIIAGDKHDAVAVDDVVALLTKEFGSLPAHLAADMGASMEDVASQMADTTLVVATRYHNIVCALMSGIPAISIGYAPKNDVLLADVGLRDFCQHIESLDIGLLKNQFERLLRDRAFYELKIAEKTAEYRVQLLEQDERLLSGILAGR